MIVVYSMNGCAQCIQASDLLTAKGVAHTVVKVDENEDAYEFFKAAGHRGVPQIYGDDRHVGDYKTLKNFADEQFEALK